MLIAAYLAMQAGKIQKNNLAHCLRNNDPVIFQRADLPAYCLYGEARLIGDFISVQTVSSPSLAGPTLTIMPLSKKNRGQYIPLQ